MAAFFVSTVSVKDSNKFHQYLVQAARTFSAFGGKMNMKGRMEKVLVGSSDHHAVGIVSFPNLEALNNWLVSAEYQALGELRNAAGEFTIVSYSD